MIVTSQDTPSTEPSPTSEPTPMPTLEPSPTSSPSTSPAEPSAMETATLSECGTVDVPCVVTLPGDLLVEFYAGLAVLVLCALASLIGSWGRGRE